MTDDVQKALEVADMVHPISTPTMTRWALDQLAAEVRRRERETCDSCRYQSAQPGTLSGYVCWHAPIKCDGLYRNIELTHFVPCRAVGNRCGAWQPKAEEARA